MREPKTHCPPERPGPFSPTLPVGRALTLTLGPKTPVTLDTFVSLPVLVSIVNYHSRDQLLLSTCTSLIVSSFLDSSPSVQAPDACNQHMPGDKA